MKPSRTVYIVRFAGIQKLINQLQTVVVHEQQKEIKMKTVKPVKVNTKGGWKTLQLSKNFALVRERGRIKPGTLNIYIAGPIRILNLKTGTLNPGLYETASDATKVLVKLTHWENNNLKPNGKARTKRHNKQFVMKVANETTKKTS